MKRASLLAVTLAVIAVLALGWWITRRASRSGTTVVALPSQAALAAESPALAEAESIGETTTREVAPAAMGSRSGSNHAEGRRVIVVDAGTNTHVPGVEVRWADTSPVFDDREHPLVQVDPESFFEAAGPGVRTDAQGRVTLPVDAKPRFVWARIDDRFGSTRVIQQRDVSSSAEGAEDIRVTIDHGFHIDIQVVDADQRPVSGVPVSIRNDDKRPFTYPLWTGVTDSGGIAHARHLQRGIARQEKPLALVAGFEFPTRTASTLPVDSACMPKAALRLVLPECGSVEVRTRDESGTPHLLDLVELGVSRPEAESFVFSMHMHAECKAARIETGRALFPFVETGLELTTWLQYESKSFRHTGHGPARNGERVTFDVDVGMQRPRLAGRLVDSNNAPLAEVEFMSVLSGGIVSTQTAVQTDALGRFTLTVPCDAEQRFDGSLGFKPAMRSSREDSGLIELDRVLHSGVNEIGDVLVRVPVVIATVRVVDENGKDLGRVPNPYVEVEHVREGVASWVHSWELRVEWDGTDAFGIWSCAPAKRMRVRVTAGDYMQIEPCVIEPSMPDVRVVMLEASEVGGRILVDDGVDAKLLEIFVRGLDDATAAPSAERTRAQSDGTFRIAKARARLVDLLVVWPDWKEPLVVLRDLDLRAGGRARDARLNEIDLRGRDMGKSR